MADARPREEIPCRGADPRAAQALPSDRGGRERKEHGVREVRRIGGRGGAAGRRSQARRPDRARHGVAAARHGEDDPRARHRAGREDQRGGSSRRRLRGDRIHREDQGRLAGHRRHRGYARRDGAAGRARKGSRAARADAEPEGGHRHDGRDESGERAEGREDRVPRGQERDRARGGGEEVVLRGAARRESSGLHGRDRQGEAVGRERPLHPFGDGLEHDGAGRAGRSGGIPRMNRTKAQKQEMVTTLAEQVGKSQTIYVTDFTGLNVAHITDLRRRLRAVGVEYVVVKNTLARRALTERQLKDGGLESFLAGPTALVLAGADPVGAAKVLTDFAREFEKPSIKVGLVEGKPVAQVKSLAALPSKQQLLAQLGGALQAPMAGFLGVMNGLLYQVVGALEALKEQRGAGAASSQG